VYVAIDCNIQEEKPIGSNVVVIMFTIALNIEIY